VALKNAKAKGTRNEHKSRDLLAAQGYYVIRAAGSLGLWDLVAFNTTYPHTAGHPVRLVQVKTNRPPSKTEVNAMAGLVLPWFVSKQIHVWHDSVRDPKIIEIK